ncbi:MAG: hypothetical protein QM535_00810 [Limnohabitans sp.]|nr:hypothetical protein [Limnohabitans sp.]
MLEKIKTFSQTLEIEIPGFIGFSVSEIKTGKCIFSKSVEPSLDMELISKYNVDFVKAKLNSKTVAGIPGQINSIIVIMDTQFHLLDLTKDNEFFFYIIADSKKSNLAIITAKLASCKKMMSEKNN